MENFYQDQIKTLSFKDMPIRTIRDDKGNTWWAAQDIADILRVDNVAMVMGYIGRDKKKSFVIQQDDDKTPETTMDVVATLGLYAFFLHSPISPAGTKSFKNWLKKKAAEIF